MRLRRVLASPFRFVSWLCDRVMDCFAWVGYGFHRAARAIDPPDYTGILKMMTAASVVYKIAYPAELVTEIAAKYKEGSNGSQD